MRLRMTEARFDQLANILGRAGIASGIFATGSLWTDSSSPVAWISGAIMITLLLIWVPMTLYQTHRDRQALEAMARRFHTTNRLGNPPAPPPAPPDTTADA